MQAFVTYPFRIEIREFKNVKYYQVFCKENFVFSTTIPDQAYQVIRNALQLGDK